MIRAHRSLNAGEVAGFPDEEADRLIKAGVAREIGDDGEKPAVAPKPEKAPKPAAAPTAGQA